MQTRGSLYQHTNDRLIWATFLSMLLYIIALVLITTLFQYIDKPNFPPAYAGMDNRMVRRAPQLFHFSCWSAVICNVSFFMPGLRSTCSLCIRHSGSHGWLWQRNSILPFWTSFQTSPQLWPSKEEKRSTATKIDYSKFCSNCRLFFSLQGGMTEHTTDGMDLVPQPWVSHF